MIHPKRDPRLLPQIAVNLKSPGINIPEMIIGRLRVTGIDFLKERTADSIVVTAKVDQQAVLLLPPEISGQIFNRDHLFHICRTAKTDPFHILPGNPQPLSEYGQIDSLSPHNKQNISLQINVVGGMIDPVLCQDLIIRRPFAAFLKFAQHMGDSALHLLKGFRILKVKNRKLPDVKLRLIFLNRPYGIQ